MGGLGVWLESTATDLRVMPSAQLQESLRDSALAYEWAATPIYDIYALVALNCAVWLLWTLLGKGDRGWMRRHFTSSARNVAAGRLHCLALATISHEDWRRWRTI